jgi:putative ABC transport system permease protein
LEPLKARSLLRPYALVYLYRRRLRVHAAQELLAGLGVAVAVALVFAVTVANSSIVGSATEVAHAVVGPATLQLRALDSEGFDERLLARVERLSGVKQAAPLLEQTATVVGPHARYITVDLAGTNLSLATLNGLAHTLPIAALSPKGIGLSRASAEALGIGPQHSGGTPFEVSLKLRGRTWPLTVAAVLGSEAFGALSRAQVAVMPLERLQQLAGLRGRITRILVEPVSGREAAVRRELQTIAAGRLTVASADQDVALLRQALRPSNQATQFFAAISALLGFLLAFNAMLLTVPERRQAIADLRLSGTRRTAIMQIVTFQALCLGLCASLVGLLAGYALSRGAFHQSPGYLAQAFTLGTNTVVGVQPLLIALAGGMIATFLASAIPMLDLRRGHAIDAIYFEHGVPGNALSTNARRSLFVAAVGLTILATSLFLLAPLLALLACVFLALATVLVVPLVFAGVLRGSRVLAERFYQLTILPVALASLRATTLRSLALVITGAVAIFGSVALGGARNDLLRGLGNFAVAYTSDADIWVLSPRDTAGAISFAPSAYTSRLASIPGVLSVNVYQSEFMNFGDRRVWVIARPPNAGSALLQSQIITGKAATAVSRLSQDGWVAVSRQIAEEGHIKLGHTLSLPTPTGVAGLKLAATTTNFGWAAGAVVMNTDDYRRLWATEQPTALGVRLAPDANTKRVLRAINIALGPGSGLETITSGTRTSRFDAIASEGLSRLGDISMLLVIAAIMAMAAALGSHIWQRRVSLAGLRLSGAKPHRLRRILIVESMLMLSAGCLTGAIAGIYGQVVIDGYLVHVTGFPVSNLAAGRRPFEILALVALAVLAVVAVPGWFAARVSPALALEE